VSEVEVEVEEVEVEAEGWEERGERAGRGGNEFFFVLRAFRFGFGV
jgi:hypothetical protein